MTHNERLMHLVLDNEASAEEERELLLLVAANPEARAQYEELRAFFETLDKVPEKDPPAALVERILGNQDIDSQGWKNSRSSTPGHRATDQLIPQPGPFFREELKMSEQQKSKRNLLIGSGIAVAVAVALVGHFAFDIPTTDSAVGTIAPAQRHRADQPNIKLDSQTSGSSQTSSVPNGVGSAGGGSAGGGSAGTGSAGQLRGE